MEIDIDSLTEEELIALNHKIVERLKFLRQVRTHEKMLDFKIGQRVYFDSPDGKKVTGILTRYNKKTVTVITEDGQQWNISPGFLKPIDKAKASRNKRKGFNFEP